MTIYTPTVDDLRTLVRNFRSEGQTSRADLLENFLIHYTTLETMVRGLVLYRKQAGALNFQLEKADDFINAIAAQLEKRTS
jgi:hypothetical protein